MVVDVCTNVHGHNTYTSGYRHANGVSVRQARLHLPGAGWPLLPDCWGRGGYRKHLSGTAPNGNAHRGTGNVGNQSVRMGGAMPCGDTLSRCPATVACSMTVR